MCVRRRAHSLPLLANTKNTAKICLICSATSWCFTILLINACTFYMKSDHFLPVEMGLWRFWKQVIIYLYYNKNLQSSILQPKPDTVSHNSLSRCQTPIHNSCEANIQTELCCDRHPKPPQTPSHSLLQPSNSQDFSVEIPNFVSTILTIICLWKTIYHLNCSLNCTSRRYH